MALYSPSTQLARYHFVSENFPMTSLFIIFFLFALMQLAVKSQNHLILTQVFETEEFEHLFN